MCLQIANEVTRRNTTVDLSHVGQCKLVLVKVVTVPYHCFIRITEYNYSLSV